eukprot:TRINITY_DN5012_c0_g2_i2.p1 TRINITY_DN5012_c0_g2~~TRINITY_DN5012_c0_g2_i2.p1  ORF type:complete len:1253 (+),score=199.46 TRINITY_DN5012_c0_g2_i2:60-3818(+)
MNAPPSATQPRRRTIAQLLHLLKDQLASPDDHTAADFHVVLSDLFSYWLTLQQPGATLPQPRTQTNFQPAPNLTANTSITVGPYTCTFNDQHIQMIRGLKDRLSIQELHAIVLYVESDPANRLVLGDLEKQAETRQNIYREELAESLMNLLEISDEHPFYQQAKTIIVAEANELIKNVLKTILVLNNNLSHRLIDGLVSVEEQGRVFDTIYMLCVSLLRLQKWTSLTNLLDDVFGVLRTMSEHLGTSTNAKRSHNLLQSILVLFRIFVNSRLNEPSREILQGVQNLQNLARTNDFILAVCAIKNMVNTGSEAFHELTLKLLPSLTSMMRMSVYYFMDMRDAYNEFASLGGLFLKAFNSEIGSLRRLAFRICRNPPETFEIPMNYSIQEKFDQFSRVLEFLAAANMNATVPLELFENSANGGPEPLSSLGEFIRGDCEQFSMAFHKSYSLLLTSLLRGADNRNTERYSKVCHNYGFDEFFSSELPRLVTPLSAMHLSGDGIIKVLQYYREQLGGDPDVIIDSEDFAKLAGLIEITEKCFVPGYNRGWFADRSIIELLGSFLPYSTVSANVKTEVWLAFSQFSKDPEFANKIWAIIGEYHIFQNVRRAYTSDGAIHEEELTGFISLLCALLERPCVKFEAQKLELEQFVAFVINSILTQNKAVDHTSPDANWKLLCESLRLLYLIVDKYDEYPGLSFLAVALAVEIDSLHPLLSKLRDIVQLPCPDFESVCTSRFDQLKTLAEVSPDGFCIEESYYYCLKLIQALLSKSQTIGLRVRESFLLSVADPSALVDFCQYNYCPAIQLAAIECLAFIQTRNECRALIISAVDQHIQDFQLMMMDIFEESLYSEKDNPVESDGKSWISKRTRDYLAWERAAALLNIIVRDLNLEDDCLTKLLFRLKDRSRNYIDLSDRFLDIFSIPTFSMELKALAFQAIYLLLCTPQAGPLFNNMMLAIRKHEESLTDAIRSIDKHRSTDADFFSYLTWLIKISKIVVKDSNVLFSRGFLGVSRNEEDAANLQEPYLLSIFRVIYFAFPERVDEDFIHENDHSVKDLLIGFDFKEYLHATGHGFSLYDTKAISYRISENIITNSHQSDVREATEELKHLVSTVLNDLARINLGRKRNHYMREAFKGWVQLLSTCLGANSPLIGHNSMISQLMYTLVDLLTQALRTNNVCCYEKSAALCTLIGIMIENRHFSDESFCGILEGLCHGLLRFRDPGINKQSLYFAMLLCLRVGDSDREARANAGSRQPTFF